MTFEPTTIRAIDRISGVIMAQTHDDIDQTALEDAAEFIETADDDIIVKLVFLAAEVTSGSAKIEALWDLTNGDHQETPEYRLAYCKAILALVRLGAEKATKEADHV
jgi:hypothetical protein